MRSTTLKQGTLLVALSLLAACSSMSDVGPGTPLSEVIQSFGQPHSQCSGEKEHLATWTTQPMGQYAWTAELDEEDKVIMMRQVLADAEFARLKEGSWSYQRVQCWFGPPATTQIIPLRGEPMQTWSYRYRQGGAFNGMMTVYFDQSGQVVDYQSGPDPIDLQDGMFPFLR